LKLDVFCIYFSLVGQSISLFCIWLYGQRWIEDYIT